MQAVLLDVELDVNGGALTTLLEVLRPLVDQVVADTGRQPWRQSHRDRHGGRSASGLLGVVPPRHRARHLDAVPAVPGSVQQRVLRSAAQLLG